MLAIIPPSPVPSGMGDRCPLCGFLCAVIYVLCVSSWQLPLRQPHSLFPDKNVTQSTYERKNWDCICNETCPFMTGQNLSGLIPLCCLIKMIVRGNNRPGLQEWRCAGPTCTNQPSSLLVSCPPLAKLTQRRKQHDHTWLRFHRQWLLLPRPISLDFLE